MHTVNGKRRPGRVGRVSGLVNGSGMYMEGLWVGSTSAISALPELKRKLERPVRMPASGARMRASRYAPPG